MVHAPPILILLHLPSLLHIFNLHSSCAAHPIVSSFKHLYVPDIESNAQLNILFEDGGLPSNVVH